MLHLSKTFRRQLSSLTCISGDTNLTISSITQNLLLNTLRGFSMVDRHQRGLHYMLINTKKKEENQLNSFLPDESFQHPVEISYTQLNARGLQMTILASCSLNSRSFYPTLVTLFCARASISNNSSLHDKNSAQILRAIYEMI